MLTRFHKILIGLLVAQLALIVVVFAFGGGEAAQVDKPLLPGFDASKVTRVQVFAKDNPKVAVDLVKKDKGWRMASAFDYPADDAKVSAVLGPIAKMAAAAPIATQQARHAQLHVGDTEFERKLVITADGKDITLYLGSPAGSRRNAVRLGGDDRVYAVSGVTPYTAGTEPRQWMATSYVNVPREDVTKLTITRDGSTAEFTHDGEAWKPSLNGAAVAPDKDETLDTTAIDEIVGAATNIEASAPADPKRDASKPTATITIDHKAATKPTIIDVIADGTSYWVHDRALDRAVTVDKTRLERAVTIERDKLIKKPTPKSPTAAGSNAGSASIVPPPPGLE
jgi:hypothetical protein